MARYRHPKHGYHVTGYGDDLAALKAAGWVLDEPAPEVTPPPAAEVAPAPAEATQTPPTSVPAAPEPMVATPPTIRRGPDRNRRGR